jgi:PAS domain-containing protein
MNEAQQLGRIGNWEFDISTHQVNWSDAVFKLYERDPAQGQPTYEQALAYYFPESRARLHECVQRAIERGETWELELHVHLPSGREAFHYSASRAFKNEHGEVVKLVSVVQDITGRKRVDEAVRSSERRLREAQAVGRIGDWQFEVQTGQIDWSDELFRLFGRDPSAGPPTFDEPLGILFPR